MTTTSISAIPQDSEVTRSHMDQREYRVWTDQHGRQWEGHIEKKSGDFCGLPPQPQGWRAPFPAWIPPAFTYRCGDRFIVDGRRQRLDEMTIDYSMWEDHLRDKHRDYTQRVFDVGGKLHGQAFDPAHPTPQLLAIVGPKPLPVEVVIAQRQGNRYALGLTPTVDERLVPYFPEQAVHIEPDFSNLALGDGPAHDEPEPVKRRGRKEA